MQFTVHQYTKRGFTDDSVIKNLLANAGDTSSIPGSGRPLEKEMATHSIILAWEIPRTESGRLQSMGSQKSQIQLRKKINNNIQRIKGKKNLILIHNFLLMFYSSF